MFHLSHERKLILLSAVLILLSLISLRVTTLLDITRISSIASLEVWAFKLAFSGVGFTIGVIALLVGIVDSRIIGKP